MSRKDLPKNRARRIESSPKSERPDPREFIEQLEKRHTELDIPDLTDDLLNESKRERRQ